MAFSKEHLARIMRVKRAERKWTQEDLADAMGVSKDSVKGWESGTTAPGFPQACRMADAFGCGVDEFACRKAPGSVDERRTVGD